MENVALSDSNDDLTGEIRRENQSFRPPLSLNDEHRNVASELHDAANTDVTKASTPFKPLFPAPSLFAQAPSTGSPLLFQQSSNTMPAINPLLQPPISMSNLSSSSPSFLQPNIRPPSAFTPLVTANNQQPTSFIQPKSTIGNQQSPFVPISQPIQYPIARMPVPSQGIEPINPPPSSNDKPLGQADSHFVPPPPFPNFSQPTTNVKEINPSVLAPPPPPPPPPTQSTSTTNANPYSARASLTERIYPGMPTSQAPLQPQQLPPPLSFQQQQQHQQTPPTPNLFMPPTNVPSSTAPNVYSPPEASIYNPSYQPPGEPNPTPWANYPPTNYDQQAQEQIPNNPSGLWGWISNNKMLATVVEKAKTGIETVITTVDPQMKQYIQPGHEVHIVVTSAKDVKLTPVRDAFTHVFGRATTQGIGVQSNVAPQPVGFEAGFKGAQQRIENLRRQNVVRSDQCVVSIENFIAELVPDMYFDLGYVLLSDPLHSIELHLFTQAVPVPIEYVYQARDRTPADYPLKWSGYAVTIGEILHSQLPFVNPEDWHEMMSGTSRRDIIYATCKSLAFMYKQRLNRQQ